MNHSIDRSKMHRPMIMSTNGMVSSGHYHATLAGIDILEKGGNAFDAGVAMGLCINVTHPDLTNLGGVAPIIIYSSEEDKIYTISGLGTWPEAVTINLIKELGGKLTQERFLCSVIPAAVDAWVTSLDRFGTLSFSEVSKRAIELAKNGFPAYPFFINNIIRMKQLFTKWEYTKNIFFPSGKNPRIGDLIIQADLAKTLTRLSEIEQKNKHLGRHNALTAVRDEFYKGSIAEELIEYQKKQGGLMTLEDMAGFHVELEEPIKTSYKDIDVYTCGPWCQGPVNNIALNILEGFDIKNLEHNSPEYIHILASSLDLAFSDREKYIGDPRFVNVPIKELISKEYANIRRALINLEKAWGKMPPPGNPIKLKSILSDWDELQRSPETSSSIDTSYGCVIDKFGNAFSATPSDFGRLVPGMGILISPRGFQSWLDPNHPSSIQPKKRPRLTPNPALAFKEGNLFLAFGTPGGDSQPQTMVQVLINIVDFHMNVQEAVEVARFRSENFPNSFWPHTYLPGRINVEARITQKTINRLKEIGYDVNTYPEWAWACGGACVILKDSERGILMGGADPRRECYAIGY
jgi:gamma-glutamyltranspeptidase/glutathione hydrolase